MLLGVFGYVNWMIEIEDWCFFGLYDCCLVVCGYVVVILVFGIVDWVFLWIEYDYEVW